MWRSPYQKPCYNSTRRSNIYTGETVEQYVNDIVVSVQSRICCGVPFVAVSSGYLTHPRSISKEVYGPVLLWLR